MPVTDEIKVMVAEMAEALPEAQRGRFARALLRELEGLVTDNSRMIAFAIIGGILGEILDSCTEVPFTEFALSGDHLSDLGIVAGAVYGGAQDWDRRRVVSAVKKALVEARGEP